MPLFIDSNEMPTATSAKSSSTLQGSNVGGGPVSQTESILGFGNSSVPGGTDEIAKR